MDLLNLSRSNGQSFFENLNYRNIQSIRFRLGKLYDYKKNIVRMNRLFCLILLYKLTIFCLTDWENIINLL